MLFFIVKIFYNKNLFAVKVSSLIFPLLCCNASIYSYADNPHPFQVGFQDPATPAMVGIIDLHHEIMFWLSFVLFFVLQILIFEIYFFSMTVENSLSIRFFEDRFKFVSCSSLETVWTIFPIYVLWCIASPSLALLYSLEEERTPDLTVKIIGRQWYWNYEFSDFIEFFSGLPVVNISYDSYMSPKENTVPNRKIRLLDVDNEVRFPIRTDVRVIITSEDVIHSWTIPSFGIKLDAIPGRLNTSVLFISRKGTFYGQCSELCGVGHGFMPIMATAAGRIEFITWLLTDTSIQKYTFYSHAVQV